MNHRARKFAIHISAVVTPDADEIHEHIFKIYDHVVYVGVYSNDEKLYMYLQFTGTLYRSISHHSARAYRILGRSIRTSTHTAVSTCH